MPSMPVRILEAGSRASHHPSLQPSLRAQIQPAEANGVNQGREDSGGDGEHQLSAVREPILPGEVSLQEGRWIVQ